jgi:hypothetical protein
MPDNMSRPLSWRARLLLRSGGIGAIGALLVLVGGAIGAFHIPDEDLAEFVLFAAPLLAPLALAPTIAALYWIYRPIAPRLSGGLLLLGALGVGSFTLLPLIHLLSNSTSALDPDLLPLLWLWYALIFANGLWPILAGAAALRHQLPLMVSVGLGGVLAGGLWIVFVGSILAISWFPTLRYSLSPLVLISAALLAAVYLIWASGLSFWLLTYPGRRTVVAAR